MTIRKCALSDDFLATFRAGAPNSPIVDLVKRDSTLEFQMRGSYINVYYRGGSVLKLMDSGAITIDKTYLGSLVIGGVADWLRLLPIIKQNVDQCKFQNSQQEKEYQQLIYRANSFGREALNTDYFPIDREFSQIDILALRWGRESHRARTKKGVPLALIEVKYGVGSAAKLYEQMHRYVSEVAAKLPVVAEDATRLISQKCELGLFGKYSPSMRGITVSANSFEAILMLVDAYDAPRDFSQIRAVWDKLRGTFGRDPRVSFYVAKAHHCGLGLWNRHFLRSV